MILRFRFQLINEVCDCFVSSKRVSWTIGFERDSLSHFLPSLESQEPGQSFIHCNEEERGEGNDRRGGRG
mgnify:FL=1